MVIDPDRIKAAIKGFPPQFGLRAFPGDTFCVNEMSCYINDRNEVVLYTFIKFFDGSWGAFSKGTVDELWREVVALPGQPALHIFEVKDDPLEAYADDPNPAPYCPHVSDGNACVICDAEEE